jgi:hypothetical protein
MSDSPHNTTAGANEEVITDPRCNPGWSIRVGISKSQVKALDEAAKQGTWFDSVEELDDYLNGQSNHPPGNGDGTPPRKQAKSIRSATNG